MISMYIKSTAGMEDPKENPALLKGIPKWRKEKILNYLQPADRKLSLLAWRVLEEVVKAHGFRAKEVKPDENGKLQCGSLCFSLSHCADMVLLVMAERPVGCDLEKCKDAPFEVAEAYFSKKEQEYILDAPGEQEKNRRFFRIWTARESYLKMTGEGLGLSLKEFETDPETLQITREGILQDCTISHFSNEDFEISVCIQ